MESNTNGDGYSDGSITSQGFRGHVVVSAESMRTVRVYGSRTRAQGARRAVDGGTRLVRPMA